MIYQLIQSFEGMTFATEFNADNIIPAFDVRGFELTGINTSPLSRPELRGQPKFRGLAGPLYGGPGVIRYEDRVSCAAASA